MSANYTLGFVHRDGNMHDSREFGLDLTGALSALRSERDATNSYWVHWYVYDADDGERGYFEADEDAA